MLNKNKLFMQLKHPMVIISLVIATTWSIHDASVRLLKPVPNAAIHAISDIENGTLRLTLKEEQIANIFSLFEDYKPNLEVEEKISIGLTKDEQLRQSGLLTEVFINDNRLTLKAIIQPNNSQKKVALIEVLNTTSNETKLQRFDDETQVFGFDLQILNNTQVQLVANQNLQTQEIILSMFKNVEPTIESQ
ncbi:hypothetical protein [Pseudoalteromonas sp. TB64]|uniref:hypothetical protein n=1 Tax=Pseudoalteromonas sp. TB64 TaxID=1938600 RepID=UPI00040954DD|nr:hypothetical protein [Pseudoalteromonas sp. TB64]